MTPEQHPGLDELILYSMGTAARTASDREAMVRVRQHVSTCAECRAEVAQMRTELALTAMAVPQIAPPASAKGRLFQAAGLDLAQAVRAAEAPSSVASPKISPGNLVSMTTLRTSPALIWGGWLAAAACLLLAVQIRHANQGMRRQLRTESAEVLKLQDSSARAQKVLDLLSSPEAQRVTLVAAHATPVPTGHAVYLPDRGALVFTASNLAPLPANKTYELWVIPANGTAPVPAGTFQPDARGMASVLMPNLPQGIKAKAFGVTMENTGGSATPTLPILLAGG